MVVVLEGGSVIDLPWLDAVPAVVMAWYPGQRGGPALAKLLWGQANFSGKLPFTWAKSVDQYDTWNGNGTTKFDYHVGYSWFDYKSREPLFPFGYGLSLHDVRVPEAAARVQRHEQGGGAARGRQRREHRHRRG